LDLQSVDKIRPQPSRLMVHSRVDDKKFGPGQVWRKGLKTEFARKDLWGGGVSTEADKRRRCPEGQPRIGKGPKVLRYSSALAYETGEKRSQVDDKGKEKLKTTEEEREMRPFSS